MWVYSAKLEQLAAMIEHCPALKLVSGPDGEIFYANAAFREWSEYALSELKTIGWRNLSVDNDSLNADLDNVRQINDGYIQSYTIRKQYRQKNGTAHWGNLTVLRYPATGAIECFFCCWEPFKNGTSTAFSLAMDKCKQIDSRLEDMTTQLKALTTQTDEDKFVLGTIRMIQRHPKIAAAFVFIALSVFGANNVLSLLQRTGIVEIPVKMAPLQVGE